MNSICGAYLEDYHYIKLIIPNHTKYDVNNIILINMINKKKIILRIYSDEVIGHEKHLFATFKGSIVLNQDYEVILNEEIKYSLTLGKITRTIRFDVENTYEGPIGNTYTSTKTTFRVWSPVAKVIKLVYQFYDFDKKAYQEVKEINLKYQDKGLWQVELFGDCDLLKYHYEVRVNHKLERALDPYAISSNANSQDNYIIDKDKTYQFKYDTPEFSGNYTDAIIYETHVRDFTIQQDQKSGSEYIDFTKSFKTKNGNTAGLNYIKELGITHIQLMPLNAFGDIDEINKDRKYNWGYNPVEYNSPSGWYSKDANDAYSRINELKEMIDKIHEAGLRVNLDVVYNHVYEEEKFSCNYFVPGYIYRTDQRGFKTNGSGCNNDIASERRMMSRFIINSIISLYEDYHFDGFRFDLMGLIDYKTMDTIIKELKKRHPTIMVYGEGWNIPTGYDSNQLATMNNYWALDNTAFFNDTFRNTIKGSPFDLCLGVAMGGKIDYNILSNLIKGSASDEYLFKNPTQSINFIECHDNYTFYDQIKKVLPHLEENKIDDFVRLGLGIVMLSQGIPFIHSMQEVKRTKNGIDNSYNIGDYVNGINWDKIDENVSLINSLKDLIILRKKYHLFRLTKSSDVDEKIMINRKNNKYFSYRLHENDTTLEVLIKNNYEKDAAFFAPGTKIIYDGKKIVNEEIDTLELDHPALYVLSK